MHSLGEYRPGAREAGASAAGTFQRTATLESRVGESMWPGSRSRAGRIQSRRARRNPARAIDRRKDYQFCPIGAMPDNGRRRTAKKKTFETANLLEMLATALDRSTSISMILFRKQSLPPRASRSRMSLREQSIIERDGHDRAANRGSNREQRFRILQGPTIRARAISGRRCAAPT